MRGRHAALVAVLLVAAVASACTSVNRLREAQVAFDQAATAENELRFDIPLGEDGAIRDQVARHVAIQNGYASAVVSLDQLESSDVDRLKRDNLWGNVLAMKALALWRLGLLDRARATAVEAQAAAGGGIQPRDRALLVALPGLIKTDEAFGILMALPAQPTGAERAAALRNVELLVAEAADAIDRGRAAAGAGHPVQVYLIQAKLAALRNLQVARQRLAEGDHRTLPGPRRADVQRLLKELDCQPVGQEATTILSYCEGRFTLTRQPGPCPS